MIGWVIFLVILTFLTWGAMLTGFIVFFFDVSRRTVVGAIITVLVALLLNVGAAFGLQGVDRVACESVGGTLTQKLCVSDDGRIIPDFRSTAWDAES